MSRSSTHRLAMILAVVALALAVGAAAIKYRKGGESLDSLAPICGALAILAVVWAQKPAHDAASPNRPAGD